VEEISNPEGVEQKLCLSCNPSLNHMIKLRLLEQTPTMACLPAVKKKRSYISQTEQEIWI